MPSGATAGGEAALAASVVVGKRTGSQLLPPSPPASRLRPQDCESGIGSRTSTLRSIASISAAALSPLPSSSESQICKEGRRGGNPAKSSNLSGVEVVGVGCASSRCPSCRMPFDKAKKRRLIDACGHERCYSCMFANEACPLCAASRMSVALTGSMVGRPSPLGATSDVIILPAKKASASISGGNPSICGSESTLYRGCSDGNCTGSGSRETGGQRPKLKTNGHFTSYMKSRKQHQHPDEASERSSGAAHSWKPPRGNAATSYANHRQQQSGSSSIRSSTTSSILSAATPSTTICRNPGGETQMRMTQSCPTPPHTRRKFFLSTKALRNPWRHHQETTGAVDPGGGGPGNSPPEIKGSMPISALMTASAIAESVTSSLATSLTSSWSSTGTWAEGALRRIKALWWGGPPTAHDGRPRCRGASAAAVGLNLLGQKDTGSSQEGEVSMNNAVAPLLHGVGPCRSRANNTRSSQGDLRMRLGLLLGEEGTSWSSSHQGCNQSAGLVDGVEKHNMERETQSPETGSSRGCRSSLSPSSIGMHHHRNVSSGCSSLLLSSPSLASLETSRPPHGGADGGAGNTMGRGGCLIGNSANTSPASTLTGSSEADVHCRGNSAGLRGLGSSRLAGVVLGRGCGLAAARDRSSDSLASLASLCSSSTSPPANVTGQHQQTRRRHSVTTLQPGQVEDLDVFGMRRASIRRSARAATVEGPLDPKIRFAKYLRRHGQQQQEILEQSQQYHRQLTLRPLFFEVPLPEWDAPRPLFIGRAWLLELIASSLGLPLLSTSSRQPFQTASPSEEVTSSMGTARRSKKQQTSPCGGHSPLNHPQHSERGVVIVGGPGTGKTALLLQLVESSCFGRHRELPCRDTHVCSISGQRGAEDKCHLNLVSEKVCALASRVVAYHFCQAENNSTCLVPDFVHSVAAQLCQAPQLAAYRDLLLSNPNLQDLLSLPRCIANPDEAMSKGILEPLQSVGVLRLDGDSLTGSSYHQSLGNSFTGEAETMQSSLQGSFHSSMQGSGHGSQIGEVLHKDPMGASTDEDNVDSSFSCIILVDALCEAEYHRPDRGPSLCAFLAAHSQKFPPWLKLVVTARTRLADTVLAKELPYKRISLDDVSSDENVQRDLVEYIHFRASHSPTIRANLSLATPSSSILPQQPTMSSPSSTMAPPHGEGAAVTRFAHHLVRLSGGSFLFTKLTLDLIERGHLVTKSSSYKVLPLTLAEIFLLHFNLRFHTVRAFERVLPILSVVLASLCPPTLLEVFYAINALRVERFLSWDEFISRFKTLSGFVVKRLDDTYMFFHPAFREWLLRREESDSNKFLCDPRIGHLGIALRLTRLQSPLEGEALLELGHHILKAHPHRGLTLRWPLCSRDLQATWVAGVAADASQSLASLRNAHAPNVKVSRLLLLAGASPNIRAECPPGEGEPLLCLAAQRGDTQVTSLLLEFGADAGAESTQGSIPLSIAASCGHQGVVAALLGARGPGAGAGRVDPRGRCPLVLAAAGGHASIVALLLSSDWVLGTAGEEIGLEEASVQALVAAATKGHTELVEYLLDMCSVSLDAIDTLTGETALTAAVSHGRHSTVAALLMRGASIKATNSKGYPPLVAAAVGRGEGGEWLANKRLRPATLCSVMELLIQVGGASPEQRDSSGRTALAHAAATGDVTLVRLLLEKGAGIHLEDREGLSALGWACLSGHQATAKVLLDAGAQVQRADASGRTPLHLAAAAPPTRNPTSTPLVQHLLERGAVLEGVDAMGLRPLDRAVGTRNIPAVHCFLRRGARLGPATWAMAAGKPDVTLILLNKLLEDGNVLYKKGRLQEASHRYRYALKKCPMEEEAVSCIQEGIMWPSSEEEVEGVRDESSPAKLRELFDSVRVHLMLNLSRCMRKLGEYSEAVELAEGVLRLRPESYEAHYARAKAKVDLGDVDGALSDIEEALRIVPPTNREARRILRRVRDELQAEACPKAFDSREPCLGEDERVSEE